MKKQISDFKHLEVKNPDAIKGGDGGGATAIIIIDDSVTG